MLEDAGLVTRSRDAQRRPVHLEAEVFDLMTKWIERYRQQAEERYQRLDELLAEMNDRTDQYRHPGRNRIMSTTAHAHAEATIEADPTVPLIRITREFDATPEQLLRAHTDPDLFARWVGPHDIDHQDRLLGRAQRRHWRFLGGRDDDEEYAFRGCFHTVEPGKIVQTFTWEGQPDGVSLETLRFEDLGGGRTRLVAESLCDSFEGRDAWLASGMEVGVNQGYEKLDALIADGAV